MIRAFGLFMNEQGEEWQSIAFGVDAEEASTNLEKSVPYGYILQYGSYEVVDEPSASDNLLMALNEADLRGNNEPN